MNLHQVSAVVAQILIHYKIENIADYLNPTLKNSLPDPLVLLDMDKAIVRTYSAINNQENIVIFADYDVDGATASAIIRRYLKDIKVSSTLYIPDRIEEGYGPTCEAMLKLVALKQQLCIMVDCGATAFEPLLTANQNGLDVIVLDHHTSKELIPQCAAVVNPNRLDQSTTPYPSLNYLCAAGVAFLFIVALNRYLKEKGYFKDTLPPDLRSYLDLVALGTVCDVMPLVGINRALVKQGLWVMNQNLNVGLNCLKSEVELVEQTQCFHLGFVLGPRINAGGRVGKANYGSELLSSYDKRQAGPLAKALQTYNVERQLIEKAVQAEALVMINEQQLFKSPTLVVCNDHWHPGVIGIVASRLKDQFNRPCLVITKYDGSLKGSGRSISGVHLGELMIGAVELGLLSKGGGHAMAAGFTVNATKLEEFKEYLNLNILSVVGAYVPALKIAAKLELEELNAPLIEELKMLAPFGNGNPTPKFIFKKLKIKFSKFVGEKHLQIVFENGRGQQQKAIFFKAKDMGLDFLHHSNDLFDIAATVKLDLWQGKQQINMIIEDMRLSTD